MLSDLKVLELASVLAGPSVGQFFAELGAEVIKIENLNTGGDVTRTWKVSGEKEDDLSAYFCSCNWGKKSVAIDLGSVSGREVVKKLATQSDIVIASYKPGDAEKLGVSYAQLSEKNSRLIYGQISGYGSDNDRVGYDAVIQAESGFMDLNGEAGGPPLKMPVALIDILAAHQLKEGLLLALLKREKMSTGSLVEVSLIQTAVASLANQATNWLMTGKVPMRSGSVHPNIAPYGESFKTKDNKQLLLAIGNDKQFRNLCLMLGESGLALSPNFVTNQVRVENRMKLNVILTSLIEKWESKDLLPELHRKKIPAGLIQNVKDVFAMPEIKELLLQSPEAKGVRNFVGFNTAEHPYPLVPPPRFGQHTEEVLKGL